MRCVGTFKPSFLFLSPKLFLHWGKPSSFCWLWSHSALVGFMVGVAAFVLLWGIKPRASPMHARPAFSQPTGLGSWMNNQISSWMRKMLDIHYLLDAFLWAGTQVVRTFRLYLRVRDWEGQSYAFNIFPKYSSFHTQRLDFSFKNYVKAVLTISFVQMLDIKQS